MTVLTIPSRIWIHSRQALWAATVAISLEGFVPRAEAQTAVGGHIDFVLLGSPASEARPPTFVEVCGRKHAMREKSDVDCTRECVQRGSKYTLILGGKAYILEGGPADTLDELAGARVLVSGTVQGDTLRVKSVTVASSQPNQSKH